MIERFSTLALTFALMLIFVSCGGVPDPEETYVVRYSVDAGDGGTVSLQGGPQETNSLSLASGTVTANPDENYIFSSWSDTGEMNNPRTFSEKLTTNIGEVTPYIVAQFLKDLVTVNTSIVDAGAGTISADKEPEEVSLNRYFRNERVEFSAEPTEGWKFKNWGYSQSNDAGDSNYEEFEENPVSVVLDYDSNQIIAYFEREIYDLSVNIAGEGRVIEQQVVTNARYESASSVRVEAVPLDGWEFVRWSGDLTSENQSEVIVMDSPKEITAIFNNLEGTQSGVSFNYSDKSNCDENGCDVELNLTIFNGHSESIEVTKIEVFVNSDLYETITSGNVITTFAPGDFHTSKIEFEDANSAQIKVYFEYNGDTYTSQYDWSGQ